MLTSKGQVTLPKQLREELTLEVGDVVAFDVTTDGVAVLRKLWPFDREWHKALESTVSEWSSPEDEEAFRDL